jgi:hypothetical protein
MSNQDLTAENLDCWQSERNLDRVSAPARHAVAAWALAAALALTAILGPPATRQVVAGVVELRHEVLMLDRELERASVRSRNAWQGALPGSPTVVMALKPDQTERA